MGNGKKSSVKMFSISCVLRIETKILSLNNPENDIIGGPWKCTTQLWMTLSKSSICAIMLRVSLKNKKIKLTILKTIRI